MGSIKKVDTAQSSGGQPSESERKSENKFNNIDEVMTALAHNGLEAANLIVGIGFTRTNKWVGAKSFHGRSLHHIGDELNPYEQAISIIGRTLSGFLDNNLIPCFGFGDGPTSFAPIIEMAITIVERSHRQYYVLLKIADGPVTGDANAYAWKQSPQIKETIEAVVKASQYPLSIIVVGVGDGPWDMMKNFLGHSCVCESYTFQASIRPGLAYQEKFKKSKSY
ncbi:hypothetical protein ACSBR1_024409 [Camellia fascicularis]